MEGFRCANIGAGVAFAFMLPSVLLLKDAGEAVMVAIGVIGFILSLAVTAFLDERDQRRQQRDQ